MRLLTKISPNICQNSLALTQEVTRQPSPFHPLRWPAPKWSLDSQFLHLPPLEKAIKRSHHTCKKKSMKIGKKDDEIWPAFEDPNSTASSMTSLAIHFILFWFFEPWKHLHPFTQFNTWKCRNDEILNTIHLYNWWQKLELASPHSNAHINRSQAPSSSKANVP